MLLYDSVTRNISKYKYKATIMVSFQCKSCTFKGRGIILARTLLIELLRKCMAGSLQMKSDFFSSE